ncbi:MAG: elongation factor P [Bacilli bacterium]|nr:elongation factor P [Bacilli bacterium]
MVNVTELRPGNYFTEGGEIYHVLDILLNKTAMRKMVAKLKVKNVRSGAITEQTYNSGYQLDRISINKQKMQYLYDSGDLLVFMNTDTYEQVELNKTALTWELNFLVENSEVEMASYDDEIFGVTLPPKVSLKITECAPGVKGNTVTNATKDAVVETGLRLRVPLFIEEGEVISVKTTDGSYDGRA